MNSAMTAMCISCTILFLKKNLDPCNFLA